MVVVVGSNQVRQALACECISACLQYNGWQPTDQVTWLRVRVVTSLQGYGWRRGVIRVAVVHFSHSVFKTLFKIITMNVGMVYVSCIYCGAFLVAVSKELAYSAGDHLQCWGPGFSPWARKIPWRRKWQHIPVFFLGKAHGPEGPGRLQFTRLQRVRHDLVTKPPPPPCIYWVSQNVWVFP